METVAKPCCGPPERYFILRTINLVTLILLIVGGLNWGLVGLLDFNLVATIFGDQTAVSRIVYSLVGASAIWQLIALFGTNSDRTEMSHSTAR